MSYQGGCHCGAIRYEIEGKAVYSSICHCTDCRRSAGAPVVAWAAFQEEELSVLQGTPKTINLSGASMRSFCPECGSGLFFRNAETIPGLVDVQTATLDDPEKLPPTIQIQTAERISWVQGMHELPAFERFPDA